MGTDGVVVLDTRPAANLVGFKWFERGNKFSERWGAPRPETYPECARIRFGDGLSVEVRCAADVPVGLAGNRGMCAASALEVGFPASLCTGALDSLGGELGSPRDISTQPKSHGNFAQA